VRAAAELECVYDYPLYYDILVGWDRDQEAAFYDQALRRHGATPGSRILEVACGTGQVAVRLAKLGWQVVGLDLQPNMLDFLAGAAGRAGVSVTTCCGDMTDFTLDGLVDAAYCPLGTVGYAGTEELMLEHLRAVGRNLRPGGLYLVDSGHVEQAVDDWDPAAEEWTMERDGVTVSSERGRVVVEDPERGRLELAWGGHLRLYSSQLLFDLATRGGLFAVEACYPEHHMTADGLSVFDINHRAEPPFQGRVVAVLRRG
jgi:SAM-dependent methyltransferase